MPQADTIWTLGHSTRSIEQFIALLKHYQLEAVADVRRFPGSRRLPQFGQLSYNPSRGEPLNARERSQGIQQQLDF